MGSRRLQSSRYTEELLAKIGGIVRFAQAPHLRDFKENPQADDEISELLSEYLSSRRLRHVLVYDSGFPGLKKADLDGIPGVAEIGLIIADSLKI